MKYKHAKTVIQSHLQNLFNDGYLEMSAYVDSDCGVEHVNLQSHTVLDIAMRSEDAEDFHHRLTKALEEQDKCQH